MPVLLRWGHCCIGSLGSLLYWFMAVLVHWGHYHCRPTKSHSLGVILTPRALTFSTQFILFLCSTYLYWSYGDLTPKQPATLVALPLGSLLYWFMAVLVHWGRCHCWGHCCTGSWLYWFTEVTAIGITAVLFHCCTGSLGSLLYWFIAVLVHWGHCYCRGHCCTGSWLHVLVHWGRCHCWGHCCTGSLRSLPLGSLLCWFTEVTATGTGSLGSLPLGSPLYWLSGVTAIGITAVLFHCCTGSLGSLLLQGSLLYWFMAVLVH